jgi:uncharacterized protein YdgA (DUF945 family)
MKKIVIGAVVALLVLAYPAATWWTGKQVESRLADNAKQLEEVPFLKVVKREFKRGLASSTEDVTIELFGGLRQALEQARKDDPAANAAAEVLQPVQLTFRSTIQHGPFAGGKVVAAAADTELIFDAKTNDALAKAFGDKKPLTARTVFDYGGAGRTALQSPAMSTTVKGADGEAVSISWDGMTMDVDFTGDMKRLVMSGKAPKFELKGAKGELMLMSAMTFSADQTRVLDDEPLLYGGKQRLEIARFEFSAPKAEGEGAKPVAMRMENIVYDADMPIAGEFIDIIGKMGAAKFVIGEQDYGPVNYDTSFKRMHARTVAGLYRDMVKMYADPALLAGKPDPSMVLGPMAQRAQELLKHNPEFSIDRISFKSPQGEALVSARFALKDATPEDFDQLPRLLPKIDASAKLVLPEAMLAEMGAARAETPEEKDVQRRMFAMQVQAFSEQGYVVRKGEMLESTIVFKDGQLTVNGKAIQPPGAQVQGEPQGQRRAPGSRSTPRKRP